MENISVFFDTNIIEAKFSSKYFLSNIRASKDFYDTCKFIRDNKLDIALNIPEIVYLELKKHLSTAFSYECRSLKDSLQNWKKCFGDLLDINHELKKTCEEYDDYFNQIWADFKYEYNLNVIEYPKENEIFCKIVSAAINSKKPFTLIPKNNVHKEYSDAGFKDAIIAETVLSYQISSNNTCILLSSDRDFQEVFSEYGDRILVFNKFDDLKSKLISIYQIKDVNFVKDKVETDDYLRERIINETGNILDDSVTKFIVKEIKEYENNVYMININIVINEVTYNITCKYEFSSNEISDLTYITEGD